MEELSEHWTKLDRSSLQCRVAHAAVRNESGRAVDVCSIAEIMRSESLEHEVVPIATAHTPPLQTICRMLNLRKNQMECSLSRNERSVVLRLAGVDYAILAGEWVEVISSKDGRNFSLLKLQVWFLGENGARKGSWQELRRDGPLSEQGMYRARLPSGELIRFSEVTVSTGNGEVDVGVEAYLLAMGASVMFEARSLRERNGKLAARASL